MRQALLSDDEKKQNKTKTVVKHLNKKYKNDEEFREYKKQISREAYKKRKEENYKKEHGDLVGFGIRKYNN